MVPFSYARRAILWCHNVVPFNGAILWHVCTRLYTVFISVTAMWIVGGTVQILLIDQLIDYHCLCLLCSKFAESCKCDSHGKA